MIVGVLALQGAFEAHIKILNHLGVASREIRQLAHLDGIDGIVLPGGESTTMFMMLDRLGLRSPLSEKLGGGLPAFGTCAGAILLASAVSDGRSDQWSLDALDIEIRRNGYGRQVNSFETDLDVTGLDAPFHAPFIRAPVIEAAGPEVQCLARFGEHPVLVRCGPVMASTFHPELTEDPRIHRLWLDTLD